ncbi:MAG: patatin-like phospholipase family protein [bacterium]
MEPKRAFVLSGGSIRGAFQAGALAEILTSGTFVPDAIYGTSVGSLNGAFLADRSGRAVIAGQAPDWVELGNKLQDFWLGEITSFDKIARKRGGVSLLFDVVFENFDGFIDTEPLRDLVRREVQLENLKASPLDFFACSVNVATGKAVYASIDEYDNMHDYIIASTAIPLVMPVQMIGGDAYVDGGIREVAPLRQAIVDGATEIYCILCQPEVLLRSQFNRKNAVELMEREVTIVTNETVNNDLELCQKINALLREHPELADSGPLQGKRPIDLRIIRPDKPIELELETFDSEQILAAMKDGWKKAQEVRLSPTPLAEMAI